MPLTCVEVLMMKDTRNRRELTYYESWLLRICILETMNFLSIPKWMIMNDYSFSLVWVQIASL